MCLHECHLISANTDRFSSFFFNINGSAVIWHELQLYLYRLIIRMMRIREHSQNEYRVRCGRRILSNRITDVLYYV